MSVLPALATWTQLSDLPVIAAVQIDGRLGCYWKRAPSAASTDPVFPRPVDWDTGTDGLWHGRGYAIRGAATTGDPWDEFDPSGVYTAANQFFEALTVSGTERLAIHFYCSLDNNTITAGAPALWTAGTAATTATGTDGGQQSYRIDNVSANTAAANPTIAAPAQGSYTYFGFSFKPPGAAATSLLVQPFRQTSTLYRL